MIKQYLNFFSAEDCDRIIQAGEAAPSTYIKMGEGVSHNLAEVTVSWLQAFDLPNMQIYSRMAPLFRDWPITRMENLQFSVYTTGGRCGWHIDYEEDTNRGAGRDRIVNAIVQLSDPNDYTEGDLEARVGLSVHQASRERGSVLVLDKEIWHRVAPLTSGIRKSLVCWGLK